MTNDRRLILISGPVAAGKTTTARDLAALSRARGQPAAAFDMDEVIEATAGNDWSLIRPDDRRRACRIASSLVEACFDTDIGLVAMAGSTLGPYEWDEVTRRIDPLTKVLHVLLRVSLDVSIRRAQDDPARVHTKNPAVVARLAAAIDWSAIRQHNLEVDTDDMTPKEVVALILAQLELPP